MNNENAKLNADMYWEWRTTVEELKSAKLNERRIHLERELLNKEIENKKMRLALFKETVTSAQSEVLKATKEYEKMKQRIEEKVGFSINNCVIDDITLEVKKLTEDK